MKRALLLASALTLTAGAASAADIGEGPTYVEPPAYVAEAFNWTGFYAGVHGGYGGDKFRYPFAYFDDEGEEEFSGDASLTSSGFFAGGQVGFNWQINQMVLGAVADIAWSEIEGKFDLEIDDEDFSLSAGSEVNWFGTVRGRIGFLPTQRLMLYATGGFAYGDVEHGFDVDFGGGTFSDSTSSTQWGWAAGGGFEYAITDRVTLFTEYLYVDLGDETLYDDCLFDCGGTPDNLNIDAETQFHTVKAGINFLFN